MKDIKTTNFARPLTFNYLSTFNGDVVLNGATTFVGGINFTGQVNACGGMHVENRSTRLDATVTDGTAITGYPTGLGAATILNSYFVGTLVFTNVTILKDESISILLENSFIDSVNDIVEAQVIHSVAAAALDVCIWATSTRDAGIAGFVYIDCYNMGGDTAAGSELRVAFKVTNLVASPC